MGLLDEFLEKYEGKEEIMFAGLDKKYGARPRFDLVLLETARTRLRQVCVCMSCVLKWCGNDSNSW